MIERLHIDGFRGLDDVELDALGQFNLIVGPGDVGKTNLLEAFFLSCSNGDAALIPKVLGLRRIDVEDCSPKEIAAHIDWFWSAGRKQPECEIEGMWDGKRRRVRISKLTQETDIPVRTSNSGPVDETRRDAIAVYQIETAADESKTTGLLHVGRDTVRMQKSTRPNLPGRFISPLEQGLSRPLASIWSEVEERAEGQEILTLLPSLDPDVTDIRIVADEAARAFVRVVHKRLGRMPLEFMGAGFGKGLSIACYILAMRDGLLLIDEFDASLHVGAQTSIIEFLLKTAEKHNVQLCVSTHSIETIDAFLDAYARNKGLFTKPGGLRVLQLKRADGCTQVTSLDADKATRLREEIGFDLRRTA